MAKQFYVYSTLSNNQNYTVYSDLMKGQEGTARVKEHSVLINGGANVADKNNYTAKGVETVISEEQAEILKSCPMFDRHVKAGFIILEDKKHEPNKIVQEKKMTKKDKSAPITPDDQKEAEVK